MDIENPPQVFIHRTKDRIQAHPEGRRASNLGMTLDASRPVLYLSEDLPAGISREPHHHPRAQLAWACSGVLRVNTESGSWVVPPSHAVWIACDVWHEILIVSPASVRYLFIDPMACKALPDQCQVMSVTPLLRELVTRLLTLDLSCSATGADARLIQVVLDELAALEPAPLYLPMGQDRRLKNVMDQLMARPGDTRSLPELARVAGASPRTLERLFQSETGLGFRQWRSRLRLLEAVERLSKGETSSSVALSLGYSSSSAFVAAFRRAFGKPPQSFVAGRE